jgi:hypothetical protein
MDRMSFFIELAKSQLSYYMAIRFYLFCYELLVKSHIVHPADVVLKLSPQILLYDVDVIQSSKEHVKVVHD